MEREFRGHRFSYIEYKTFVLKGVKQNDNVFF